MLVKATKKGFHGQIRLPGDTFEIDYPANRKMPSWFVRVRKQTRKAAE